MADESIAIDIFIEADKSQKSLGDLKKGFELLEKKLQDVDRSTAKGKKEFDRLSTAMAQSGREIKNIELSFESLDSEQVASEMGSVAGAVGDVTASVVLLGGESETMQKFAETVQTAIGISIGFKGAIEGVSSASKLYTNLLRQNGDLTLGQIIKQKAQIVLTKAQAVVTGVASVAMKVFNAVMSLNPLALVAIAIGLVVTGFIVFSKTVRNMISTVLKPFLVIWDSILTVFGFATTAQRNLANETEKASQRRINALRQEGKEAVENAEINIEASKRQTAQIVTDIEKEIRIRTARGEAIEDLTKKKLETIKAGLDEEVRLNSEAVSKLSEIAKKQQEEGDVFGLLQTLQNKDQLDTQLKDQKKHQEESTFELELFNLEQEKIEKDNAEKAREERRKRQAQKEADEKKAHEDRLAKMVEEGQDLRRFENIRATEINQEKEEVENTSASTLAQIMLASAEKEHQLHLDKLQRIKDEDEARQQNLNVAQAGLDILNASADLFVKDEIKRDKIKKKLAIAQLAIDTARAISAGIAQAMTLPPPGNIIAALSTVATVLANMAQAKQLLSSAGAGSVSLPSGGSTAGGGTNINPVSNNSTLIGEQPNPVVSVQEINTVSNKVDAIEQSATIG